MCVCVCRGVGGCVVFEASAGVSLVCHGSLFSFVPALGGTRHPDWVSHQRSQSPSNKDVKCMHSCVCVCVCVCVCWRGVTGERGRHFLAHNRNTGATCV